MKLAMYFDHETMRMGAVVDGELVDVPRAWTVYKEEVGLEGQDELPRDIGLLLWSTNGSWQHVRDLVDWVIARPVAAREAYSRPLDGVRLIPPVNRPSKIICVGLNYHDHCREQDLEVPTRPILFSKFPSTITGPNGWISWPKDVSQQVDYEVELAVVIGSVAKDVPLEEAYKYVAGYTVANDVSARDAQFADKQWIRGKSFDTFCPLGPYLVTADEVPDPHTLDIRCWLNGELMQESNTRELIFGVDFLIEYISRTSTLNPGDIILTGTPGGVGVFRDPQVFLQSGDVVKVAIDGLGSMINEVR